MYLLFHYIIIKEIKYIPSIGGKVMGVHDVLFKSEKLEEFILRDFN